MTRPNFRICVVFTVIVVCPGASRAAASGTDKSVQAVVSALPVSVKQAGKVRVMYLEETLQYWETRRLFARVAADAIEHGHSAAVLFQRFLGNPLQTVSLACRVGAVIDADWSVTSPYRVRERPAERVAYVVLERRSPPTLLVVRRIMEWVDAHGYEAVGPVTELLIPGERGKRGAARQWRREIQVAVRLVETPSRSFVERQNAPAEAIAPGEGRSHDTRIADALDSPVEGATGRQQADLVRVPANNGKATKPAVPADNATPVLGTGSPSANTKHAPDVAERGNPTEKSSADGPATTTPTAAAAPTAGKESGSSPINVLLDDTVGNSAESADDAGAIEQESLNQPDQPASGEQTTMVKGERPGNRAPANTSEVPVSADQSNDGPKSAVIDPVEVGAATTTGSDTRAKSGGDTNTGTDTAIAGADDEHRESAIVSSDAADPPEATGVGNRSVDPVSDVSFETLIQEQRYEDAAIRLLPEDQLLGENRIWIGQVAFRIKALGKGAARKFGAEATPVVQMAEAVSMRHKLVTGAAYRDALANAIVRVDLHSGGAAAERRAITRDLDRLMRKIALRTVGAPETLDELSAILLRMERILHPPG
ncbi:MAG: hypothetical protein IID36_05825 [Planctomycetes bacterium]|nr:hypothetical protein [Planctomycetota bacterium]